jgi:hypothetical protein
VLPRRPPSSTFVLASSVASFLFVAVVAAVPGSPFAPVLPAPPGGPFRWLAGAIGLDAVHGTALVAVGVVAVASAAVAFAYLAWHAWRGRVGLRAVVVLAIVYHLALLLLPLLFSRDVYSYAYYGKIAATYHANPYVTTPADLPRDELAAFVGPKWFDTPAVYGPLWTQVSAFVVRVVGSVEAQVAAFRALAIAASLGTVWVVARVARAVRPERAAFAVAAIGANPVVVFQSVASGHNDLAVALAVAGGFALVLARRHLPATAVLALGALVKVTGALPLLLHVIARVAAEPRGRRWRVAAEHVGVAGSIGLVAALPFLNARDPTLGVLELAGHEGWLAPSRLFRRALDAVSGGALGIVPRVVFPALLLGAVVLIARELVRRAPASPWLEGASWAWALVALLLLGPVLLPWYVAWALPLVWVLPLVPRTVLLGTGSALTLSQWTSEPSRFAVAYDANILFGHYVLTPLVVGLLGWLLADLVRRSRARAPLEDRAEREPAAERER